MAWPGELGDCLVFGAGLGELVTMKLDSVADRIDLNGVTATQSAKQSMGRNEIQYRTQRTLNIFVLRTSHPPPTATRKSNVVKIPT